MKKIGKKIYSILAFTGLWLVPFASIIIHQTFPAVEIKMLPIISLILVVWTSFNNIWSVACEGKRLDEIGIGDGLVPETGLKKESAQKRVAMYPKVPLELLSKEPEGIILGKYKERYVRIPLKDIYHYCILGGSGSGKTSTVLLDTLLANFATGRNDLQTFCIDIKGEINQKSTFAYDENVLVVNPSDRTTVGWDAYYRLHHDPDDNLIVEAIEEISQALIISTNPKDSFFVENARTMFTGLLVYYFKQGEYDRREEIIQAYKVKPSKVNATPEVLEQHKRRIADLKEQQKAINSEFWKLVEENRERLRELRSLRYPDREQWENFTKGKLQDHYREKFDQSTWIRAKAQAPDIPEVDGTGIKNVKSHRR